MGTRHLDLPYVVTVLVLQPLATHASALELWQEVTVVSKGDKHLLKVKIMLSWPQLSTHFSMLKKDIMEDTRSVMACCHRQ